MFDRDFINSIRSFLTSETGISRLIKIGLKTWLFLNHYKTKPFHIPNFLLLNIFFIDSYRFKYCIFVSCIKLSHISQRYTLLFDNIDCSFFYIPKSRINQKEEWKTKLTSTWGHRSTRFRRWCEARRSRRSPNEAT